MKNIFLFTSLILTLLFTGCAEKAVEVKQTIVFPSSPEDPKILYLDTYRGGETVQETTFSGMLDTFLGEAGAGKVSAATIVKPYGTGLLNGKVYVADSGSDAVFIMDEITKEVELIGTGVIGRLVAPVSIAFDRNNTLYVSDSRQKVIQGYNSEGKYVYTLGGRMEFVHPTGMAIDKDLNRIYVIDTKAHHFKAFDIESKELLFTVGERGREDGEFNYPTNIAVDRRNGNVVVCDTQNFRIQIFDKDGNFIRRFGKIGDRPGNFARPKGVAVDSEGHIYVTDTAFNNIQIFDENGQLLLYFGSAGYGDTQFRLIAGIYIDDDDKIAIADGFSGRVQTFQYISENWKAKNPEKYEELKKFKPQY